MAGPSAVSPTENLTIEQAVGDGMLVKSAVLVLGTAIAAGVTSAYAFPTYDDDKLRFIIGLFPNPLTTGLIWRLLSSGRRMFEKDGAAFSATHGPMGCYVPVAKNVQAVLEIYNSTAGSLTPTIASIDYAIHDPNWVIGG